METKILESNKISKKEIEQIGICNICQEFKIDYRFLPNCGHSFCIDCIENLIEDKIDASCPLCRKEFIIPENGIFDFHKNFTQILINELIIQKQKEEKIKTDTDDFILHKQLAKKGDIKSQRIIGQYYYKGIGDYINKKKQFFGKT